MTDVNFRLALTIVVYKIQESYAMDWVLEDVRDRISDSQFGGLAGMSGATALLLMLQVVSSNENFKESYYSHFLRF